MVGGFPIVLKRGEKKLLIKARKEFLKLPELEENFGEQY